MDKDIIDKITLLANRAKNFLEYEKVIIYGSYANNTFTNDSDIDVAFIVNNINSNHWDLSAKLFELVDQIDVRIEPLIVYPTNDKSGFAENLLSSGFLVC